MYGFNMGVLTISVLGVLGFLQGRVNDVFLRYWFRFSGIRYCFSGIGLMFVKDAGLYFKGSGSAKEFGFSRGFSVFVGSELSQGWIFLKERCFQRIGYVSLLTIQRC